MRSVPVQGRAASFFGGILADTTCGFVQACQGGDDEISSRSIVWDRQALSGMSWLSDSFFIVDRTWGWDPEMFSAVFLVNIRVDHPRL